MLFNQMINPEASGQVAEIVVGETRIHGFDRIENTDNQEIANYIHDVIPTNHLDYCPEISYEPNMAAFRNPDCLGVQQIADGKIFIGPESRFESKDSMLDVLAHEIGHNVYANLEVESPVLAQKWEKLYRDSMENYHGLGFVSDYAMTDYYEDFAECYMTYIHDPALLQAMSPEKYTFMKYNVFDTRQYEQVSQSNGFFISMDEYIENIMKEAAGEAHHYDIQDGMSGSRNGAPPMYHCFTITAG